MKNDIVAPLRVIAIDPGYDRAGVAILEKIEGVDTLLYSGCVTTNKKDTLSDRLFFIGEEIERLIILHSPTHLAIETLFFNKNIKTGIAVAEARGIILFLGKRHHCDIHEYGPQEIKVAVTGYGNSDKKSVFTMVERLIKGVPTHALDDEYDAIAVGITALAHIR